MRKYLLVIGVVIGLLIAAVDSRPTWDDTGITATALLLSSGVLAFFSQRKPWLIALAVGIWIPLAAVVFTHNYGGVLALVFTFAGAYGGWLLRKWTASDKTG